MFLRRITDSAEALTKTYHRLLVYSLIHFGHPYCPLTLSAFLGRGYYAPDIKLLTLFSCVSCAYFEYKCKSTGPLAFLPWLFESLRRVPLHGPHAGKLECGSFGLPHKCY